MSLSKWSPRLPLQPPAFIRCMSMVRSTTERSHNEVCDRSTAAFWRVANPLVANLLVANLPHNTMARSHLPSLLPEIRGVCFALHFVERFKSVIQFTGERD